MGFWTRLGVAGFRVDAALFLIELSDPGKEQDEAMYAFLREMHDFVVALRRRHPAGRGGVAADKVGSYFGDGDRMHMLFNFLVNQRLFLALAPRRPSHWRGR